MTYPIDKQKTGTLFLLKPVTKDNNLKVQDDKEHVQKKAKFSTVYVPNCLANRLF